MTSPARFHGTLEPSDFDSPRARLAALFRQAEQGEPEGPPVVDPGSVREREDSGAPRAGPEPPGRRAHAATSAIHRTLRRWLPETWLQPRLDPGWKGRVGLGLAAVVALVVVVAGWWMNRPVPEPAMAPPVPEQLAPPVPPAQAAAVPPPADLVVSVVGEVKIPGLVTVRPGGRVADALESAGGPLPGTDITALNLARRVVDGEQLYVAVPIPPGVSTGAAQSADPAAGGKVDLNTANEEQFDALPGIGQVTAERLVQWRAQHGRFSSVDQLGDVEGIGDTRLQRLRELVRV